VPEEVAVSSLSFAHPADRRSPLHTTGDLRSGRRHGQATVPQQGEKAGVSAEPAVRKMEAKGAKAWTRR